MRDKKTRTEQMYRFDYVELKDGIRLLYRFLTIPGLTRPEVTVCNDSPIQPFVTYDNIGSMTEKEFRMKVTSSEFDSLLCVASTDKDDTRRVTLCLLPTLHTVLLSFPSARGRLNADEEQLLLILQSVPLGR